MTPERIEFLRLAHEFYLGSAWEGTKQHKDSSEIIECIREIQRLTAENSRLEHDMEMAGLIEKNLGDQIGKLEAENAELKAEMKEARENFYNAQRLQAHPHPEARPTPSSALTKALEPFLKSVDACLLGDMACQEPEFIADMKEKYETLKQALRASPGGEGEIERAYREGLDTANAQLYGAEIRGANWALRSNLIGGTTDQATTLKRAKEIVDYHHSPAPEKEGRQ